MAKRRAGDKARAVEAPAIVKQGARAGIAMSAVSGKGLVQLQAEQMAERRFTEMMAAAGVSSRTMMAELLYWVPDSFRDAYIALTVQALRGTDGGTEDRAKAGDQTAAVGKAKGKTGGGRKYKKYWVVQDEDLLELKTRIDKRLRQAAAEITEVLDTKELAAQMYREWASSEAIKSEDDRHEAQLRLRAEARLVRKGRRRLNCSGCGIIISATWKFCPSCGKGQELPVRRSTNRSSKSK